MRATLCRWCYASGHMEVYEEVTEATFHRNESGAWPDELTPAISDWFGGDTAAEVLRVLADPTAFAPG